MKQPWNMGMEYNQLSFRQFHLGRTRPLELHMRIPQFGRTLPGTSSVVMTEVNMASPNTEANATAISCGISSIAASVRNYCALRMPCRKTEYPQSAVSSATISSDPGVSGAGNKGAVLCCFGYFEYTLKFHCRFHFPSMLSSSMCCDSGSL